MTPKSCLYEGAVRHRRFSPIRHEFQQRLYLLYLDLDELPELFNGRWLWSSNRPSLAWFRRKDHLGPPSQPLRDAVNDLVQARCGRRPAGPIRLLTHLRYAGFFMNPISLYYCHDQKERVEFIVAEVNNTPWGEQHCYVLDCGGQSKSITRTRSPKALHVSPFLGMDFDYQFALSTPGESLSAHIEVHSNAARPTDALFDATLTLSRRPIDGVNLASMLVRYPLMTAQVYAGIYFQALRLWMKQAPYFPHPDRKGGGRQRKSRTKGSPRASLGAVLAISGESGSIEGRRDDS